MLKDKAKSLSDLIGAPDGKLNGLAEEARRREALADYLRKNLPVELAHGFSHCNLDSGAQLVVVASSSEWAARLRFESDTFIRLCAEYGTAISEVKVRVGAG